MIARESGSSQESGLQSKHPLFPVPTPRVSRSPLDSPQAQSRDMWAQLQDKWMLWTEAQPIPCAEPLPQVQGPTRCPCIGKKRKRVEGGSAPPQIPGKWVSSPLVNVECSFPGPAVSAKTCPFLPHPSSLQGKPSGPASKGILITPVFPIHSDPSLSLRRQNHRGGVTQGDRVQSQSASWRKCSHRGSWRWPRTLSLLDSY